MSYQSPSQAGGKLIAVAVAFAAHYVAIVAGKLSGISFARLSGKLAGNRLRAQAALPVVC